MSRPFPYVILLALAVFGLGCDTTATRPSSEVVVEAYLRAGAPLSTIRLTRTAPVDTTYRPSRRAIRGAEVTVQRLAEDESVLTTVRYAETDSAAGVYAPERRPTVQPQSTYRMRATTPDGTELTAVTTVPGPVSVTDTENDTTSYPGPQRPDPPQFALTVAPAASALDRQNVYVLTATSLLDFQNAPTDTLQQHLTPFYADDFDPASDTLTTYRVNSSGLLNEANFQRNEDGTVTITLPWLAVAFYGPNRIDANVVDDNLYDFLRTEQAQQMGLGPGEIPNVIEHVKGGTGVFGSYAQAGERVLIRRPGT